MAKSESDASRSSAADLDPVVAEAMKDLTTWVCRSDRRQLGRFRSRPRGMINADSRAAVIHAFSHLMHANRRLEPAVLREWALANGWPTDDAEIMRDYAEGSTAGVRYHAGPDPFGPRALDRWAARAAAAGS